MRSAAASAAYRAAPGDAAAALLRPGVGAGVGHEMFQCAQEERTKAPLLRSAGVSPRFDQMGEESLGQILRVFHGRAPGAAGKKDGAPVDAAKFRQGARGLVRERAAIAKASMTIVQRVEANRPGRVVASTCRAGMPCFNPLGRALASNLLRVGTRRGVMSRSACRRRSTRAQSR